VGAAPGAEGPDAFRASVARAIADGAAWLRQRQASDGSWKPEPGPDPGLDENRILTAQVLYVLLRAGATRDDAAVQKGFEWLASDWVGLRSPEDWALTPTSWALLALVARLDARADSAERSRPSKVPLNEPAVIRSLAQRLEQLLSRGGRAVPATRDEPDFFGLSTASLAMAAARRGRRTNASLDAPAILERVLTSQEERGTKHPRAIGERGETDVARGFALRSTRPTLATTTSALATFHVAWSAEPRRLPSGWTLRQVLEGVHDGYAWLDLHWPELEAQAVAEPAGVLARLLEFVQIERMTAHLGSDSIGSHDAFVEMAQALLAVRNRFGVWHVGSLHDPRATTLALLVLTRSTRPIVERPFLEPKAAPAK
jgi:hypothetical protein